MNDYSLYETLLGIFGLQVTNTSLSKQRIDIYCRVENDVTNNECPNCGEACNTINQYTTRKMRDLDISGREVWLHVETRQWYCRDCNRYFQEQLWFADLGKSYTRRMAAHVYQLARSQCYTAVGGVVNMCAKTVERIVLAESERLADLTTRYAQVTRLGIDEQSHRKGRNSYFCVLTDLDRGIIIDILPSRLKADLVKHFQGLGTAWCAQITAVSCDVWDAYIGAAETCFPNAYIALDRFHIVKLLNKCVDTFRTSLRKEFADTEAFKKLKWILFKQYHTLTDEELDRLDAAFEASPELKVVYQKREEFHHILDNSTDVETALSKLLRWQSSLTQKGIAVFEPFTKLLDTKRSLVANYVTDFLTNAVTEGLNNLIRSIRRVSFGLTNFHNLRWRVLAIST